MSKILNTLIILLLIFSLSFLGYGIYKKVPQGTREFFILQPEATIPENTSKELVMFMPNMRFATNNISYSFSECDSATKNQTLKAFEIVSQKTQSIYFYESQNSPMISIYCSEQKGEQRNNSFVAGEGGPNKVIESDLYPLIIDGKIYIYDSRSKDKCEYQIVELHELMHVFGFDHLANKSTILYPYVDCEQRLTDDIVSELKRLYSVEAKSDIKIKNLSATTSGRYLNFEIVVSSRGLIKADNVNVEILDTTGKIGNFSLGNIDTGVSQSMKIENMMLPLRQITDITFKISTTTPEYFYDNNEATAQVKD
jgi:hypothetical protein